MECDSLQRGGQHRKHCRGTREPIVLLMSAPLSRRRVTISTLAILDARSRGVQPHSNSVLTSNPERMRHTSGGYATQRTPFGSRFSIIYNLE
jgi:hypothetical protein